MNSEKINQVKNFSMAKAILAALWQSKALGKESLLNHRYLKTFCSNKHVNTHRSCISRLCKVGLLKKEYNDIFVLTDKGLDQARFAFIEAESGLIKKDNQKWDGGWRIVFFDIPEKKRRYRDYLRKVLKLVGFREFQRSIWAYPYPVPPFLKDLIFDENVRPHVRFITTDAVDDDGDLRRIFGLF